MEKEQPIGAVARNYLDLWLEHWSASLNSPEILDLVVKGLAALTAVAGQVAGDRTGAFGQGAQSEAVRTAPNGRDERADELESRIAALERRLAALEADAEPRVAGSP